VRARPVERAAGWSGVPVHLADGGSLALLRSVAKNQTFSCLLAYVHVMFFPKVAERNAGTEAGMDRGMQHKAGAGGEEAARAFLKAARAVLIFGDAGKRPPFVREER
jgi:hypothetical protein